jgi:hypothetical protein
MKKLIVVVSLLLTGCFGPYEHTQNTVDTINDQKLNTAKISIQSTLSAINHTYLLEPNKFSKKDDFYCIDITKLAVSSSYSSGKACINDAGQTKAIDIVFENYICNGSSNSLECVKVDK